MVQRIQLTNYMRSALNALLDKYEASSCTSVEQFRRRPPAVTPEAILPQYYDNQCPMEVLDAFHRDMKLLETYGDIILKWERVDYFLKKICLNIDHADEIYTLLGRKRAADISDDFRQLFSGFVQKPGTHEIVRRYCLDEIAKIDSGKKTSADINDTRILLYMLREVLDNQSEVFEREFSVRCCKLPEIRESLSGRYFPTKVFQERYQDRIFNILRKYRDFSGILPYADTDNSESKKLVFAEYQIVPADTLLMIRGDGVLIFDNGDTVITHSYETTPVYSRKMCRLTEARIHASTVMTVENPTSFYRVDNPDVFYIATNGYHKQGQENLIKNIYKNNPGVSWRHFGDLDPWGFCIIENLSSRTGIPFRPFRMGLQEYLDDQYAYARIPLTDKDRSCLDGLLKRGMFTDILSVMNDKGYKFEQEAITLE